MKILTISNCQLEECYGSGYVITNFCRELQKNHHDVTLCGPNEYELWRFLRPRMNSYRLTLGMLLFIIKYGIAKNFDLIEFYGAESWLAILYLRIFRSNQLIIHHTNGPEPKYFDRKEDYCRRKWYHFDLNFFFKLSFKKVQGIITVSNDDRNWLIDNKMQNSQRVVTIHPGLEVDYLGLELNLNRGKVFGYCGTWLAKKGIDILKRDVPCVLRKHPDSCFYLIGADKNYLKQEHFPLDVCNQIEVIPFTSDKNKLKSIYHKLAIFILPSRIESFGLVMVEAMACGCALVCTKVGFAHELVNMKEAYILDNFCTESFSDATDRLMTDVKLRKDIARAGWEKVQDLSWTSAGKKISRVYNEWQT